MITIPPLLAKAARYGVLLVLGIGLAMIAGAPERSSRNIADTAADEVAEQIGPFASIDSLQVRAYHYHGPGGRAAWLIEYDIKGRRHVECLGGMDVRRTLYDGEGRQLVAVVSSNPEPRSGIGPVEFTTIELPVSVPLMHGRSYQFQVEASCLDEMQRPHGRPARSPRVRFMAVDVDLDRE